MKISINKYAEVLSETLKDEKDKEAIAKKIQNLLRLLVKRKQGKLIRQLPEVFKEVWFKKHGRLEVRATLPKEPSAKESDSLKELLSEAFKKDVILSTKIDPDVLGGMKLEFGQYIIDGTVTANLEKLKYHIIS